MLYRTLLTSAESPRLFLQVTLGMLPVNALANYALIMGVGPVPALGPAGAGVSSLLVATATLLLLIRVHRRARGTQAKVPGLPAWAEAAAVLRVGVPIGIATVGEVGIFLAVTLYAGRLGTAEVAAHTLALRAAGVAYAIPAALLQASLVRMARAESAGDRAAGRGVVMAALGVSLTAGAGLCAAFVLGAVPLSAAFFDTSRAGAAAAAMAAGLLMLLGAMELFGTPGAAASGLLRGRKDARAPMLATLFGHWAVGAPLGVFLCEAQLLGVTGLWIGLLAGTAVSSVLVLARLVLRERHEARPCRRPGLG
jgi:MATE family multidrug resistance protein